MARHTPYFDFDGQSNLQTVNTYVMGRPTPIVADRIWDTKENAQSYIDDVNSSAFPGMRLSVIKDTTASNNGLYYVKPTLNVSGNPVRPYTLVKLLEGVAIDNYVFGSSSTGASTSAKTVATSIGRFSLKTGNRFTVYFNNRNTANNPTLNVNSTGAKLIYFNGSAITTIGVDVLDGWIDFIIGNSGTESSPTYYYEVINAYNEVEQNGSSSNEEHSILVKNTANTNIASTETNEKGSVKYTNAQFKSVTINTSSGVITAPGFKLRDTTTGDTKSSKDVLLGNGSVVPELTVNGSKYLKMVKDTNGVTIGWEDDNNNPNYLYGTTSTAVSTQVKVVSSLNGDFVLDEGARITVYFPNKNTANSPQLNIDNTGLKNIYYNGTAIGTSSAKDLLFGNVDFVVKKNGDTLYYELIDIHNNVEQSLSNETDEHGILLKATNGVNEEINKIKFVGTVSKAPTIQPSTGKITTTGYKLKSSGTTFTTPVILLGNGNYIDIPASDGNTYLKCNTSTTQGTTTYTMGWDPASTITDTWRDIYTNGTLRANITTTGSEESAAVNFENGNGITVSYKHSGTSTGQSGSNAFFTVNISGKVASTTEIGSIKLGFTNVDADGKYALKLGANSSGDASERAYVQIPTFGPSGLNTAKPGLVPSPDNTTAGTSKLLCESATWRTTEDAIGKQGVNLVLKGNGTGVNDGNVSFQQLSMENLSEVTTNSTSTGYLKRTSSGTSPNITYGWSFVSESDIDTKVRQEEADTNDEYSILLKYTNGTENETNHVWFTKPATIDTSSGNIICSGFVLRENELAITTKKILVGDGTAISAPGSGDDGKFLKASVTLAGNVSFSWDSTPTINDSTITLRGGTSSNYISIGDFTTNNATAKTIYIPVMTPATTGSDGVIGLVPKPYINDRTKFLRGDGTWQPASGSGSTVSITVPSPVPTIGTSDTTLATITIDDVSTAIKGKIGSLSGGLDSVEGYSFIDTSPQNSYSPLSFLCNLFKPIFTDSKSNDVSVFAHANIQVLPSLPGVDGRIPVGAILLMYASYLIEMDCTSGRFILETYSFGDYTGYVVCEEDSDCYDMSSVSYVQFTSADVLDCNLINLITFNWYEYFNNDELPIGLDDAVQASAAHVNDNSVIIGGDDTFNYYHKYIFTFSDIEIGSYYTDFKNNVYDNILNGDFSMAITEISENAGTKSGEYFDNMIVTLEHKSCAIPIHDDGVHGKTFGWYKPNRPEE